MILYFKKSLNCFVDEEITDVLSNEIELNLGDAKEGDEIVFGMYEEADIDFYNMLGVVDPPYYLRLSGYARLGKPIKQNDQLVTWKLDVVRPFVFTRSLDVAPFKELFNNNSPYIALDYQPSLRKIIEKECNKNANLEFRLAFEILDELNSLESLHVSLPYYTVDIYDFESLEKDILEDLENAKVYPPLELSEKEWFLDDDEIPF